MDQRFTTGAISIPGVGVLPALGGSILPLAMESVTLKSSQFLQVTAEVGSTMPLSIRQGFRGKRWTWLSGVLESVYQRKEVVLLDSHA